MGVELESRAAGGPAANFYSCRGDEYVGVELEDRAVVPEEIGMALEQ